MKLLSIQVGQPRTLPNPSIVDASRTWTTGFYKEPVQGPVWLGKTNLVGDGQADLINHGGIDKAVNVYPFDHFAYWQEDLNIPALPTGAFGENFTTQGAVEKDICVGDTYTLGEALVQVSQPRQPCWKLSRRWQIKDLAARVERNGRTGWYVRVLREGHVEAGQSFQLVERPFPQWTIALANEIMHHRTGDLVTAAELAACPALSVSWQEALSYRAKGGQD